MQPYGEPDEEEYTITGTLRQTLPFSISPLPGWVGDLSCYAAIVPQCPTPENPVTVLKIKEKGKGRPAPLVWLEEPHVYTFDEMGRCSGGCLIVPPSKRQNPNAFGAPRPPAARYCRHEQLIHVIYKFFTCYRCGRELPDGYGNLFDKFEIRQDETGIYSACLNCEAALQGMGFSGLEVASYGPKWQARYYTPAEGKLLLKMAEAWGKGAG